MKRKHYQINRRTFLRRAAVGSLGIVSARGNGAPLAQEPLPHAMYVPTVLTSSNVVPMPPHGADLRGVALPTKNRLAEGRFGVLFKHLQPFAPPDDLLTELGLTMRELGEDVSHAENDRLNDNPNPEFHSGFTFLGQFIDHDITFDTTLNDQQVDPDAVTNFRTPRFDLDSVYGRGPAQQPELYDRADPNMFLIVHRDDGVDDVPRDAAGKAIIADSRNDQHLIIVQLQLALMKFHNRVVDYIRSSDVAANNVFARARQLVQWHFQWIVIHEFLPCVGGQAVLDQIYEERADKEPKITLRYYRPTNTKRTPFLPIEFAAAAYRFGHSLVRPRYTINTARSGIPFLSEDTAALSLNGARPIPADLVAEWRRFFPIDPAVPPRRARRIDTRLSGPLFTLPQSVVPPPDPTTLLAVRNLLRGKRLGLPSGQQVAQQMGVPVLSNEALGLRNTRWQNEAPLWFYILKEAEVQHDGTQLGAVGGRIVAEVLVALLQYDTGSYFNVRPTFRPMPPIAPAPGRFTMADLLMFAGVG
jgi:hypothetical protein